LAKLPCVTVPAPVTVTLVSGVVAPIAPAKVMVPVVVPKLSMAAPSSVLAKVIFPPRVVDTAGAAARRAGALNWILPPAE